MQVQNYGQNGQKPNIFAQWRKNRAEQVTQGELRQADKFRSDKTSADEVKRWVFILLLSVTAITVFLAVQYYTDVFTPAVGVEAATILAILAAIAVEVGKIKLSKKVVHAAVFGWWNRSWADLGLWLIVGGLALGCFWWSITVSMRGMKEYAANKAETTVERPKLAALVADATRAIDQQIQEEKDSRSKAEKSTWKGQPTVIGLETAKQNNANIANLQAQRATIVDQVTRDYQAQDGRRTQRVDALTGFITRCGGWMELASLLCILALGFVDFRLIQVIREGMEQPAPHSPTPSPTTPRNGAPNGSTPNGTDSDFWNERVYLNQTRVNNAAKGWDTRDTAGTQQNTEATAIGADEILKAARTELQRECYNLRHNNGDMQTVSKRAKSIFNRVGKYAENRNFQPSEQAAQRYYEAATVTLELLENVGHPYEYSEPMLKQIEKHLPADFFKNAA